jgi:bacteriorhodopsin
VGTAAFARMWCDMLASFGWLARDNPASWRACWRTVQSAYLVAFLAIVFLAGRTPEKLIIFGQYVSGLFSTPLLMIAICWMAFRTDRRVRMSRPTAVLLVASVAVIATCVVASVILQLSE